MDVRARSLMFCVVLTELAVHGCSVRAQDQDTAREVEGAAAKSGAAGMLLPLTVAPRTDAQRALVRTLAGYDWARGAAQLEAVADVSVYSHVALRVGTLYSERPHSLRPTLGARVQALSQEQHGLDLGVGVFYRPEGFTQAEGEVELLVSCARRFGRLTSYANLGYGQDPEAAERDAELRLGALYALSQLLQVGIDTRLRLDLGSEPGKRRAEGGAAYDWVLGPTASHAFGPIAVIAQAGASLWGISRPRAGVALLAGLAGVL